jgi:hypothetical protein
VYTLQQLFFFNPKDICLLELHLELSMVLTAVTVQEQFERWSCSMPSEFLVLDAAQALS